MTYSPLYYLEKQESNLYSHKPQGILNVNRFVQNLAPWRSPALQGIPKQKAIILADWRIRQWSRNQLADAQHNLGHLIEQGFKLYIWQENKVVPLLKKDIYYLNNYYIRPASEQVIKAAALKQHQLIASQTHILDNHWMGFEAREERALYVSSFPSYQYIKKVVMIKEIAEIIEINKRATPPVQKIIIDEFSPNRMTFYPYLVEAFSHLPFIIHLKKLSLNAKDILKVLSNQLPKIDTYMDAFFQDLENRDPNWLKEIECLTITGNFNAGELEALLSKMLNLKSLELLQCNKMKGNFSSTLNLSQLETLKIEECVLPASVLSQLIRNAAYLRELELDMNHFFGSKIKIPTLKNLDTFYLNESDFSSENFVELCQKAPHLSSITLIGLTGNKHDKLTEILPLSRLETLRLADLSDFSIAQLLLAGSPNLKSLAFYDHRPKEPGFSYFTSNSFSLSKLERLNVSSTPISGSDLIELVKNASGLEYLNISKCQNIGPNFPTNYSFQKMKKLCAENSSLCSISFSDIFDACPAISSLSISIKPPSSLSWREEKLNSEQLEELTIVYLKIIKESCISFTTFLEKAPKLNRLNLDHCYINKDCIKQLLRSCPNLNSLHIKEDKPLITNHELEDLLNGIEFTYIVDAPFLNRSSALQNPTGMMRANPGTKKEKTIDADTYHNPEKEFNLERIFFPLLSHEAAPEVFDYRLEAFDSFKLNLASCDIKEPFTLQNIKPNQFTKRSIKQTTDLLNLVKKLAQSATPDSYFLGRQVIQLSREWQAIPSLSADEELTHVQLEPNVAVEIQYSQRDNLYYIRAKNPNEQSARLDFLVRVPKKRSKTPIPKEIQGLIRHFNDEFSDETLDLTNYNSPNGLDYLDAIITQQRGSCRHRVLAFKALMEKQHPDVPVRIIFNDCHAFVEILIQNKWIHCDLGGYSAKLTVNESFEPTAPDTPSKANAPQPSSAINYDKELETWNRSTPLIPALLPYCQQLIQQGKDRKKLVELTSSQELQDLQLSLQKHCQNTGRPFFYVNSPDDLICSAPFVARIDNSNEGRLTKGPGGPLFNFLQVNQNKANAPIILINYERFDPDDIVRFNTLLDVERKVDGVSLTPETLVLGLLNVNKIDCYQGEDFYSRFDKVECCPVSSATLISHAQEIAPSPFQEPADAIETTVIDLFQAADWAERLLGFWQIKQNGLYFVEGELANALATGLAIEIKNGPWDDEKFIQFWQQALLNRKIDYQGLRFDIPDNLTLVKTRGYDWDALKQQLSWQEGYHAQAFALNPATLNDFFQQYQCNSEDKALDTLPGLLEQYAKQTLLINLTRSLTKHEWAMLLVSCQKHVVHLQIHYEESVEIPEKLFTRLESNIINAPREKPLIATTEAIISTDTDTTIHQLREENSWLVLDISECEGDDLLHHIEGKIDKDTCTMDFTKSKRALLTALDDHKNVILKGHFSQALADELTPFLLDRSLDGTSEERLVIISEKAVFPFLPTKNHVVEVYEKKAALIEEYHPREIQLLSDELKDKEELSQLKARLNYLRRNPDSAEGSEAWQGMYSLPKNIVFDSFAEEDSAELANEFKEKRLSAINTILQQTPFLYATGLTGSGKTTFIERYLPSDDTILYQGESRILEWALDSSDKRKILFIDEANLSAKLWSELEGLFDIPPGILINGQYYPLTEQHKVVFAGNPLDYGDERHLATLFARHGNALIFDPLPPVFIYEEILKPVFANGPWANQAFELNQPFLEIYEFLCNCSENTILISPRELQMMALLLNSVCHQQNPQPDEALFLATHYAYQIGINLVPEKNRKAFIAQFKPKEWHRSPFVPLGKKESSFLITPSRQPVSELLDDLFALAEYKIHQASNDIQRYGGLGGIILEGEPGIGKSELAIEKLLAHGYEEVHSGIDATLPDKPFYRMPVSLSTEEKKAFLLQAFHQGAVVIIDEINSSPMMERFLNHLLMGKTAEGMRPDKPGFMVIGTQNPVSMGGRHRPSTALARRFMTVTLAEYPHEEIVAILQAKGVSSSKAQALATSYEKNLQKAKQEHLTPAPTFRDLLKLAKQIIEADKRAQNFSYWQKNKLPPKAYRAICMNAIKHDLNKSLPEKQLQQARALLNDYTKNNSKLSLWLHGHAGRHAINLENVNALVRAIDQKRIASPEALLKKLQGIYPQNPQGSLARRIEYIKNFVVTEHDYWLKNGHPPKSYRRRTEQVIKNELATLENQMKQAKALLKDYISWRRLLGGHWSRTHLHEVRAIIKALEEDNTLSPEWLMAELKKINSIHQTGSLARRMEYMKDFLFSEIEMEKPSAPQTAPLKYL